MDKPLQIDRPPRIQPELPIEQVEIPKPPEHHTDGAMRILQVLLPALTIVGYIAMMGMGGQRP
jgi:DNA segregation ATPase FtsK/SpoIIIE, S-DNA-T family